MLHNSACICYKTCSGEEGLSPLGPVYSLNFVIDFMCTTCTFQKSSHVYDWPDRLWCTWHNEWMFACLNRITFLFPPFHVQLRYVLAIICPASTWSTAVDLGGNRTIHNSCLKRQCGTASFWRTRSSCTVSPSHPLGADGMSDSGSKLV